MWLLGQASFFEILARVDIDLASAIRLHEMCPDCGAPLDSGPYPRQPRGGPVCLPDSCKIRQSLCCRRDGCRSRRRTPSVLFLERRVYYSAAFILASVLLDGATPRRVRSLAKWIGGASTVTLRRWRQWWRAAFPQTLVGRTAATRVVGLQADRLPAQLFDSIEGADGHRLEIMLKLMSAHGVRAGPIVHDA